MYIYLFYFANKMQYLVCEGAVEFSLYILAYLPLRRINLYEMGIIIITIMPILQMRKSKAWRE